MIAIFYHRDFFDMPQKPYDYLIFIGRFQPFHLGHQAVMRTALESAEKVMILVGSSYQPRLVRNPWSFDERQQFIRQSFFKTESERVIIAALIDLYNDDNWVSQVEAVVNTHVSETSARIGLIGHSKDHSSYYLSLFPQWGAIDVASHAFISASPLRDHYFSQSEVPEGLPDAVSSSLQAYLKTDAYCYLKSEYDFLCKYKKAWESAPYPPIFVTVDAVVLQNNHVLLIERAGHPGKGLFALPGGFVDEHERLKDAVIRELHEETQINLSKGVLETKICSSAVFDSPYRSARGRTISHAYLFVLDDTDNFVEVLGADDAKCAFWLPIDALEAERMFEDHRHIVQTLVRQINNDF